MPASPVATAVQSSTGTREEPDCRDRSVVVSLEEVGRQQEEVRKIKRLVAMFRLWGSKSEMQMTPLEDHLHHQTQAQQQQQQQIMTTLPMATSISLPYGTSEPIGGADLNEVPVQRLWQSLVVPLVLGCVIFLLAIWTRQISLLVVNDAIVMVLILGSVFIVMSAVAFWLAQEQQHQHHQQQQSSGDGGDDDDLTASNALSADNHTYRLHHHHHHQCPHHHHHRHHPHHHLGDHSNQLQHLRHHLHLNQQQGTQNQELAKCCSIAFIDLQPPDYYSALRHSFPVMTPMKEEANGGSGEASANSNNASNEPPSYAELARHQLEFQDQR